jgi:phage protein U
MIFQLGNKEFSGLYAPEGWSYSGNEAVLSQYDLIGTKPRLQFGSETLEELSLNLTLRADFCNINQEIQDFETWKSKGEILPFILGNGEYIKDFVLKSVSKTISQTFSDGSPVEIQVSLSLLEVVPDPDKKKANDRKNAKAVGNKQQVNKIPPQAKTSEAQAHKVLMDAQLKAWEAANIANQTVQMENPASLFDKVKKTVNETQDYMSKAVDYISEAQQQINNATGIISSINQSVAQLTEIKSLMKEPFSLENVKASVLNLKSGLRSTQTNSTVFTKDIIVRKI